MPRKLTTKEFIEKAKKVHGDNYNYSLVEYKGTHIKVRILCKKCGKEFLQTPASHLRGIGCPYCAGTAKLTTEEFIKKARAVYGKDRYDYSKVEYKGALKKVRIFCKECGKEFTQTPSSHLSGEGCPYCAIKKRALCLSSNTEEFIEKAKKVHGDKYDYSLVDYTNSQAKVRILCKKCGKEFLQIPASHLMGIGCPYCVGKAKLTTEEFIEKAKKVHGDKYDYSLVEYKNCDTKVRILCKKCGKEFLQTPASHLRGIGCPYCAIKERALVFSSNTEEFIEKAKKVHGDKYDYSLVDYTNSQAKVRILCKKCGKEFTQTPHSHLSGNGCPYCAGTAKLTTEEFIEKARAVHGDKYDYSLVEYKGALKKVRIFCKECGKEFTQTSSNHLKGAGCPRCKESKGEIKIGRILEKYNIKYETQKRFNECRYKNPLPFDFYIPSKNMAIEFDGIQHFEAVRGFGGIDKFKSQKKRDFIKDTFCKENGIKLLRISYKDADRIEEIIKNNL